MMEELEDFDTAGFVLKTIIRDARENDLNELADEIERCLYNTQVCYDMCKQKWTSTGENPWKLDVEELKARLK